MAVVFVTGTDTGVGKTVLTTLLVRYLRNQGVHALAMKPFCSGSRADVDLLWNALSGELSRDEINPYHYPLPVAPLVAAREAGQLVKLPDVLRQIRTLATRCELLLVEGAGGLYVPLGKGYTVADLIGSLRCSVVVAARNRLGTVNHSLLTLAALTRLGIRNRTVVLIDAARPDESGVANAELIQEYSGERVFCLPSLGNNPVQAARLKASLKKVQKTLARLTETDTFTTALRDTGSKRVEKKKLKKSLAGRSGFGKVKARSNERSCTTRN